MLLGQAKPDDYKVLKQICIDESQILWINDYYDGPLQGIVELNGKRLLFDMIDRDLLGQKHRRFWLINLNRKQLAEEQKWHELFCKNVGTHLDYTDRERHTALTSECHKFYDPYKERKEPDYSQNEIVGWFLM